MRQRASLSFSLIIFFSFFTKVTCFAQSSSDTSQQFKATVIAFQANFYKNIGSQSHLYNAEKYPYYDPAIKGNAYFQDIREFHQGSVDYDGYFYSNISLLYDLYKDKLVMVLPNGVTPAILISDNVKSFDLLDHHFIYLKEDPLNSNSLKTGFYDELYGGSIQVLAKRSKSLQTEYSTQTIESYFHPAVDYYLVKNGRPYTVDGQGSFLAVLKDRKKELQQYIKSSHIKFKKDREGAMASIAAYYDRLNK